jgi:hypothetical protein
MSSLKRIAGKPDMRRKRVRKTVGRKRDPEESEKAPEKTEEERKAGDVIFTFRIGADFHPEALFRMLISRSEKLSGFRRPAEDVRMLPVFTAGITDPDHSVSEVPYIPVFFPAALMNFQRPF